VVHWGGGVPFTFVGDHWLQIERIGESTTRLYNNEDFSGLIPLFAGSILKNHVEKTYNEINLNFKQTVENKANFRGMQDHDATETGPSAKL